MRKSILIICTTLITFSLTVFGFMNWGNTIIEHKPAPTSCNRVTTFEHALANAYQTEVKPDLIYKVESRFLSTITKEELDGAKSIIDIFAKDRTDTKESYKNVRVTVLNDVEEVTEIMGTNEILTAEQIELLQSTDYASNIRITAICKQRNPETKELEDDSLVCYKSIVPAKAAEFSNGYDELIKYLKKNSKKETKIIKEDKLKPGKVNFIVTKEGTISNVNLEYTSGYPSVDEVLVKLVKAIPGKWNPATNAKGEKVDQKLVFFFGLEGC